MRELLNLDDFEKLNNALMEVECIVNEYYPILVACKNYKDLEVLMRLRLKLDEAENIIIEECRSRFS